MHALVTLFHSITKRILDIAPTPLMRCIICMPLLLCLGMTIMLLTHWNKFPSQIPLYYSRPWGEDQLTTPMFLFLLPGGTLVWYTAAILLIYTRMHEYHIFSQLLLASQVIIALFATLVVVNILMLVT